jgi:hypothetical protein
MRAAQCRRLAVARRRRWRRHRWRRRRRWSRRRGQCGAAGQSAERAEEAAEAHRAYAAETNTREITRALRPNTPILALDVERHVLHAASRLRPDAPDGRHRVSALGNQFPRARGELRALEKWCEQKSVRQHPLVVLYSSRDDCSDIMLRSVSDTGGGASVAAIVGSISSSNERDYSTHSKH